MIQSYCPGITWKDVFLVCWRNYQQWRPFCCLRWEDWTLFAIDWWIQLASHLIARICVALVKGWREDWQLGCHLKVSPNQQLITSSKILCSTRNPGLTPWVVSSAVPFPWTIFVYPVVKYPTTTPSISPFISSPTTSFSLALHRSPSSICPVLPYSSYWSVFFLHFLLNSVGRCDSWVNI